jgi:transglutaminase-like putative cysteine protease
VPLNSARLVGVLALLLAGQAQPASAGKKVPVSDAPKSRTFFFTYAATVKNVPANKRARIWLPMPSNSSEQEATLEVREFPARGEYEYDPVYGNRILYLDARADQNGRIPLLLTYRVVRKEVRTPPGGTPLKIAQDKIRRFLQADNKVPVGGKPLQLLKGNKIPDEPIAAAKALYDLVNRHMHYSKEGTGLGLGDAVWACDSKSGNCTDFHSLFISLARSQKIPAKFEIGFALPAGHGAGKVAGYHCWAWFLPAGKAWIPVDVAEANRNPAQAAYYFGNLTEDRVAFSVGRDITLVPRQSGPSLNFFIDPYAEVDGRPVRSTNIFTAFSFQDLPARDLPASDPSKSR